MGLKSVAEERLQRTFADVGTKHAGEFYVPASAIDGYIDACVHESLAIAGIEVFRLGKGGTLKADLSQLADFSTMFTGDEGWDITVRATAAEAHRFVGQAPSEQDVRFNFTLLSEGEFRSR
ncbi:MAG: hypothetical protein ACKVPX_05360 [Myxococcaceae bacterium]